MSKDISVLDISTSCRDYTTRISNRINARQISAADIERILSWGNNRKEWAATLTHGGIRKYLPYGMWMTAAGEWVLFNRRYQPFMTRSPDGKISGCDPERWVADIVICYYFFYDGCTPNNLFSPAAGISKSMIETFDRCCEVIRLFNDLTATPEDIEHWRILRDGKRVIIPKPVHGHVKTNSIFATKKKECEYCDAMISTGGAMRAHIKAKHPEVEG